MQTHNDTLRMKYLNKVIEKINQHKKFKETLSRGLLAITDDYKLIKIQTTTPEDESAFGIGNNIKQIRKETINGHVLNGCWDAFYNIKDGKEFFEHDNKPTGHFMKRLITKKEISQAEKILQKNEKTESFIM